MKDKVVKDGGVSSSDRRVDPVSGNEVPLGSEPEEVRDDIDARLSEGEYVVPADVVKFFGVNFFEELRSKAKDGFQDMEAEGRIGGQPVDVLEDVVEEMSEEESLTAADQAFNQGGMVNPNNIDMGALLDNAKLRAARDPNFSQMLKAKGISIQQAPQGSTPPEGNMGAPVQMNVGGFLSDMSNSLTNAGETDTGDASQYISAFAPYLHQLGFSSANPTGYKAASPEAQCGPGTVWDADLQVCVLDTSQASETSTEETQVEDNGDAHEVETESGKWMDRYDYTNPEKLAEQTMSTLGSSSPQGSEDGGFLNGAFNKVLSGGILGGSLPGSIAGQAVQNMFDSQKYAEAVANAEVLRSQGHVEQADLIQAQADKFAEENSVRRGSFFDSSQRLTREALAGQSTDQTTVTSSDNEDTTNVGNYGGDRDGDGVPNWRDFNDGVGWADTAKEEDKETVDMAQGGLMSKKSS